MLFANITESHIQDLKVLQNLSNLFHGRISLKIIPQRLCKISIASYASPAKILYILEMWNFHYNKQHEIVFVGLIIYLFAQFLPVHA